MRRLPNMRSLRLGSRKEAFWQTIDAYYGSTISIKLRLRGAVHTAIVAYNRRGFSVNANNPGEIRSVMYVQQQQIGTLQANDDNENSI
jgi:hypothetical protein